jgi:hypothetical protein
MLWWQGKGRSKLGQKMCEQALRRIRKYESRGFKIVGNVPPIEFHNLFKPWKWGHQVLRQISAKYDDSRTVTDRCMQEWLELSQAKEEEAYGGREE